MTLRVSIVEKKLSDGSQVYDVVLAEKSDPWEAVRLPAVTSIDAVLLQCGLAGLITKHCATSAVPEEVED